MHQPPRYAMIMAGGSGQRLWPLSRTTHPKQLLPMAGGRSLLAMAWDRLDGLIAPPKRLVCSAERFREPISHALEGLAQENFLGEPLGRDTLNAVALSAAVLERRNARATFAVLTSDHIIEPADDFRQRLAEGFKVVEADPSRFVTFAITPTYPATAYGYVERGQALSGFQDAFAATRFVEKPDRARAEQYLASGAFGWNSGMFIFSAHAFLQAVERFCPANFAGMNEIARAWDTPKQRETLERVYPTLPKISIDYAIMEPASKQDGTHNCRVCVLPMSVQWLDIGSYPSYGQVLEPDAQRNRSNAHWTNIASTGCLVLSDDPTHVIATVGCEDLIVVHTKDATLVCPLSKSERVKEAAEHAPSAVR